MKYSKKHPLWPVYDFQSEILKRGGKIDNSSDLMAYFEGRSIHPDWKPINFLVKLAYDHLKNKKIEELICLNYIAFREAPGKNSFITQSSSLIISKKWDEPLPFGYSLTLNNEFSLDEIKKNIQLVMKPI